LGFLTLCKFPCIIMMETKMPGYGYGYEYGYKDTTFFLKNFGYDTSGMNNMFTMMNTLLEMNTYKPKRNANRLKEITNRNIMC